jgi:hypothetical protein
VPGSPPAPGAREGIIAPPEDPGTGEPAGSTLGNTETLCKAYTSMIRSTVALCELAGEDSAKCDEACAKTRKHAAQLMARCNLDTPKIEFKEHKTAGKACGSSVKLGVGSPFDLTNAAEVVHHAGPYARCFLDGFEVRRTVEDKTYQQVGGAWSLLASTPAGTDDTPGPGYPACMTPPFLYSYDSPGWPSGTVRQLPAGGTKVSSSATGVELRMNFYEWIRATGPGITINTDKVEWSNVLKLSWSGGRWNIGPGSAIGPGHVKL